MTTIVIRPQVVQRIVLRTVVTGPRGPKGDAGPFLARSYPASGPLSAPRVVTLNDDGEVIYFDPFTQTTDRPVGVLRQAAGFTGQQVEVVFYGPVVIPDQGFLPRAAYFAGSNGALVTVPPMSAITLQEVGTGLDEDTILVRFQQAIEN